MAQKKQYREAAHLLQAVQQLVLFFKEYKQIRKIQELADSVASIQAELRRQILGDFAISFNSSGELQPGRSAVLVEACELVSVLDNDVKWVTRHLLRRAPKTNPTPSSSSIHD